VLTPHNLPRKIKMADERIKLTRTISTESQIFLFCLMSSVCVQHEDCKFTHTHTTHTLECRKEPYTHTHSSSSSCCLSRNFFFFYSISFFFFFNSFYFIFSFFAPHTHTQHTTTGMGGLHDLKVLSRMNFFFYIRRGRQRLCVCVHVCWVPFFIFPETENSSPFFSLSSCCLAPPPPHEVAMPRLRRHLAANSTLDRPRPLKSHPPFL
jgi:hypothetical protein